MPCQCGRVLIYQVKHLTMFFRTVITHTGVWIDQRWASFTKIRVNEVNTAASENVAEVESVTSTLTCVEYTPKEVEETSLLHGAS